MAGLHLPHVEFVMEKLYRPNPPTLNESVSKDLF
jgi:hypothetical protein